VRDINQLVFLNLLVLILLLLFFRRKRKKVEDLNKFDLTFLLVKPPPGNEIEIEVAEQFFTSLCGFRRSWFKALWKGQYRISFEIVAKSSGIGFYVVIPDELALAVEKKINGAYPDAEIDIVDPNEVWDRGDFTDVAEIKLSGAPYYPIRTFEDLASDALSSITASMGKLSDTDVIALQYIIKPAGGGWRRQGNAFAAGVRKRSSDPEKGVTIDTSFLEGVEKKISKLGFDVSIRVVSIAENKSIAKDHIQNVATAFEQFTDVKYNKFKKVNPKARCTVTNFIYRKPTSFQFKRSYFGYFAFSNVSTLNTQEMATIFSLSYRRSKNSGNNLAPSSQSPMSGKHSNGRTLPW